MSDKEQEFIYSAQKKLCYYIYIDKSTGDASSNSPVSITGLLNNSLYDRWMDSGSVVGYATLYASIEQFRHSALPISIFLLRVSGNDTVCVNAAGVDIKLFRTGRRAGPREG